MIQLQYLYEYIQVLQERKVQIEHTLDPHQTEFLNHFIEQCKAIYLSCNNMIATMGKIHSLLLQEVIESLKEKITLAQNSTRVYLTQVLPSGSYPFNHLLFNQTGNIQAQPLAWYAEHAEEELTHPGSFLRLDEYLAHHFIQHCHQIIEYANNKSKQDTIFLTAYQKKRMAPVVISYPIDNGPTIKSEDIRDVSNARLRLGI